MAQVVLESLVKAYPDQNGRAVKAVNGIGLTIADGEFLVLLGPSGCGKTTTLRMIAGLEAITSGTVRIGDRVVNSVLPKDRDIAMVFQNYALYPHMTVRENLAFGLRLRRLPTVEREARVRETAALLGLEDCLDRKPKALSGGQRQRVALGRAIVRKPAVFLFDEPLSNLDAAMRVSMRAEILRLRDRLRATMVYVTHDQVEAMTMGDRICVMNAGSIQQVGAPLDVYRAPANRFVAGFLGSPAMNFFPGRCSPSGAGVVFTANAAIGSTAFRVALPPALGRAAAPHAHRPAILGVRPEHIREAGPSPTTDSDPARVNAVVELVEPLGAETHLHARMGDLAVVARFPGATLRRPGEAVSLALGLDAATLFDAETGLAWRGD